MDRLGLDFDALGITDDLMFGTVFQDVELCRRLVETLLGIEVEGVELVERQGHLGAGPLSRAGVVDILVRDASGDTYDVEMQNSPGTDIAQRARYYLSLVNATMLDPGQGFGELRGAVVVFICTRDPFGRGWKRYDFPRVCVQDGEPLRDGTEIVFVNAQGTRGDVGQEFDAFIEYLSDDTMIGSDYVRRVDSAVRAWRDNPLWRRYRMLWSEKYRDDFAYARAKGREDGYALGHQEGLAAGREEGREEGRAAGREEGRTAGREEGLAAGREEGLAAGREEGRTAGREEGLAAGREEGLTEGRKEGRAAGQHAVSLLADRLEAEGRIDELLPALRDSQRLAELMHEFDLEG